MFNRKLVKYQFTSLVHKLGWIKFQESQGHYQLLIKGQIKSPVM